MNTKSLRKTETSNTNTSTSKRNTQKGQKSQSCWGFLNICCPAREGLDEMMEESLKKSLINKPEGVLSYQSSASHTLISSSEKEKVEKFIKINTEEDEKDDSLCHSREKFNEIGQMNHVATQFKRLSLDQKKATYPRRTPFILKSGQSFVIAIIHEYRLKMGDLKSNNSVLETKRSETVSSNDKNLLQNPEKYYDDGNNLFSLYKKGVKIDGENMNVTPEKLATYLAKRLKGYNILVDAFCGVGGNMIQFAKESDIVFAVDINEVKIHFARHNAKLYDVLENIEFINADFLGLKNMKADIVFLDPPYEEELSINNQSFGLRSTCPLIKDYLKKALSIAKNVVISLPSTIDISDLAILFSDIFEDNSKDFQLDRYSIEIEKIFINDNLERYFIYYGDCCSISKKDERNFLVSHINADNPNLSGKDEINLLKQLIRKVGHYASLYLAITAEEKQLKNHTRFQKFIDLVQEMEYLSIDELLDLKQRVKDKRRISNNLSKSIQAESKKKRKKKGLERNLFSYDQLVTPGKKTQSIDQNKDYHHKSPSENIIHKENWATNATVKIHEGSHPLFSIESVSKWRLGGINDNESGVFSKMDMAKSSASEKLLSPSEYSWGHMEENSNDTDRLYLKM